MWKAIIVTLIIFSILYAGIYVLKQSANKFKVPKDVKPQPYANDNEDWGKDTENKAALESKENKDKN